MGVLLDVTWDEFRRLRELAHALDTAPAWSERRWVDGVAAVVGVSPGRLLEAAREAGPGGMHVVCRHVVAERFGRREGDAW